MKRSLLAAMVMALFVLTGMNASAAPSSYASVLELSAGYGYSPLLPLPSPQFRLSGTVVGCDGEPIPGAIIQIKPGGYSTTTDANGAFSFCCLPAGMYEVNCSFAGFGGATVSVVMDRDQHVSFVLCCG